MKEIFISIWNHLLCDVCWHAREPSREPVRLKLAEAGTCCNCGVLTRSGIYVREDAAKMRCAGLGPEHTR